MACQLRTLNRSCSTKTTPGVATAIYYIEKDQIATWPTLTTPLVNAGDSVLYSGNFTLVPSAEWKKITAQINKNSLKSSMSGEPGSGFENVLKFAVQGNDPAAVEFANCVNSPCEKVFLVKTKEGYYRVLGTEEEGANVKSADLDTGEKPGDFNGAVYEIMATGDVSYFYTGTITPIQA